MSENTIKVVKETGGATLTHDGETYEWKKDGDAVEVPYDWALELIASPGGEFSAADDKAAAKAAEKAEHEAATQAPDEPPRDAPVHDAGLESRAPDGLDLPAAQEQLPARPMGSQAPESGDGSKITPKQRAGTRPAKKG